MAKLLCRLFIKDYNNTQSIEVRTHYGIFVGIFGIITNCILAVTKIILGFFTFSIAIITDGVNNLMDSLSSVITIIGFKISKKKPDHDHPFGHQRIEYVISLIISILIIVVGFSLLKESIVDLVKLIRNNVSDFIINNYLVVYLILGLSILVKLYQFYIYRYVSRKINSTAIKADSIDSLNDVFTTLGVLLSVIIYHLSMGSFNGDSIVSGLISLYIIFSGISLVRETINPLLGSNPTQDDINRIISIIESYDGVLGVHDLIIHNYGPQTNYVTVHVEVRGDKTVNESHELIDLIERDFKEKTGLFLTIHMDPVSIDDEDTNEYYEMTKEILTNISEELTFHDFRVKHDEEHIILFFDCVLPKNNQLKIDELKNKIINSFRERNDKIMVQIEFDEVHNYFETEK